MDPIWLINALYVAVVADIVIGVGLALVCIVEINKPNKRWLVLCKPSIHFNSSLIWLCVCSKLEHFSCNVVFGMMQFNEELV